MNRTSRPTKRVYGAITALVSATILFSAFAGIAAATDDETLVASQGLPEAAPLGSVATSASEIRPVYAPLTLTAQQVTAAPASAPMTYRTRLSRITSQRKPVTRTVRTTSGSELATARALLARQIALHPILKGTTVSFGKTPNNYQAVAYYTTGHIVINPNHRASLSRIIAHEVWHIIDWRDNHRIDWGENVPR